MSTITLSAEDAQQFLVRVNQAREAFGLEPVDKIDYADADPGSTHNCLSARNVLQPILDTPNVSVSVNTMNLEADDTAEKLATAWGADRRLGAEVRIPEDVLKVTDAFDSLDEDKHATPDDPVYLAFKEAGLL